MGTLPLDQVDSTTSFLVDTSVIWGHLLARGVSEPPSKSILGSVMGHESHGTAGRLSFLHLPGLGVVCLGFRRCLLYW